MQILTQPDTLNANTAQGALSPAQDVSAANFTQTPRISGQEAHMSQPTDSIITHLQQSRAVQTLPDGIKGWLEHATDELLQAFKQEFPEATRVNRQDVAANPQIQKILRNQGEKLCAHSEFSASLSGKFIMSRVTSQPKGSVGEKPSDTNSGLTMGAFHTAAGLAEIICKNSDNWNTALEQHFSNIGILNKPTDPKAA